MYTDIASLITMKWEKKCGNCGQKFNYPLSKPWRSLSRNSPGTQWNIPFLYMYCAKCIAHRMENTRSNSEVCHLRCAIWSVLSEVCYLRCAIWSVLSEVCHLRCAIWSVPSEVCHLKCAIWGVPSEVCHLRCAIWSVLSEVCHLKCAIWGVPSEVCYVRCAIWGVPSEVYHPRSAFKLYGEVNSVKKHI